MAGTGPFGHVSPYLVEPEWLFPRIGEVGDAFLLIDTRSREDYEEDHILHSVWLDVHSYLLQDTSDSSLSDMRTHFQQAFQALGVTGDEHVVFYENETGMCAPRGFWLLQYLGHPSVHVLDGGLEYWSMAGGGMTRHVTPAHSRGALQAAPVRDVLATAADVNGRLDDANAVIVDVRSEDEYRGVAATDSCEHARTGHIPGAVWLPWRTLVSFNGQVQEQARVGTVLEERGITPDKEIIVYSHRGARSANTYLALNVLGFPRVRNYIGSWHEWGNREDLPCIQD